MTVAAGQNLTLEQVLADLPGSRFFRGADEMPVSDVQRDSRLVKPGSIFVAIPGTQMDGARFIEPACENGAAVIVTERAPGSGDTPWVQVADARLAYSALGAAQWGHPNRAVEVIGITGTNGKSTVASILQQLMINARRPAGLLGTVHEDDTRRQVSAERTTPEAPDIHGWLRRLAEYGVDRGVMEVSSHSLVLKRVAHVEFRGAVFTNLSRDHLDFHGDMEQYFLSKLQLFTEGLKAGGYAVVPTNSPYGDRVKEAVAGHPLMRVGKGGDLWAEDVSYSDSGISMILNHRDQSMSCQVPLLGPLNLENFLLAAGAALMEGLSLQQVVDGAAELKAVAGRFERIEAGQPFTVVVDFAHTDDALRRALQALRPVTEGRLITLFGCGGDRDTSKRPLMGAVALRLSDVIVVTSDNPRSEDPQAIIDQVLAGLSERERETKLVHCDPDRAEAIRWALQEAKEGDLVALMGKGHEDYQEINGEKKPFSDQQLAAEILAQRGFAC